MKTLLRNTLMTMVTLLCAVITANAESMEVTYVLSAKTYVDSTSIGVWNFRNGITVTNQKGKGFATGSEEGFKLSAGVQHTVSLPSGLSVTSITVSGYDNYEEMDSYIKEINGNEFAETDYVFPMRPSKSDYVVKSYTIDFATPAKGSFTITPAGKQLVCTITINGTLEVDEEDMGIPTDYIISSSSYVDRTSIGNWNFKNDITVVNVKGKGFSNGLNNSVKYSKGVQFTVKLPEGFKAKSVIISGFGNDDANDTYLAELNGVTFGAEDYVFNHRTNKNTATMMSHEIFFDAPVTGEFTFTPQGAQAAWIITVSGTVKEESTEPSGEPITIKVAISTYQKSDEANTALWYFEKDVTVSNAKGKTYSTGFEDGVKYSNNVQYSINLPKNVIVNSVTFKGYNNYPEADAYLKEINGESYDATQYVFPQKVLDETAEEETYNYVMASHTVEFTQPVTDKLTFTPAGKQVVLVITLNEKQTHEVKPGDANGDGEVDVTDIITIANYILNIENTKFVSDNADYDGNGEIDVTDIMKIVSYILSKE